ncbi:hypothetical protein Pan216_22320 [Planctomycetes bacterium Pan216]|uniref:Uncharacterized protein n=1 Tax=Kolteria novifilia TaxID=2527975 RepID=A0A518B377_9BACT|nr:hypothetical protein Pan216_22320 [Planctomycetes bacterium Pan216]
MAETKLVDPSKELRLMLAFFGESDLPQCYEIDPDDMPEPYNFLLVHDGHMTVTLETFCGSKVSVHPYQVKRDGGLYARKLDLRTGHDNLVVMTGIMLFNFSFCSDKVRDLILEEKTPLGRILIENNILRQVSSRTYLRIDAKDPMISRFELPEARAAYGRIATIFCDGKPAVDLLEIVRPGLRKGLADEESA